MYTWCSRSAVIQAEKTKDITRTRRKSQVHVSVKKNQWHKAGAQFVTDSLRS